MNYIEIIKEAYKICSPYTSYDEKAKATIKLAIERSNYSDIHKANMQAFLEIANNFNEFCAYLGQYILACMF